LILLKHQQSLPLREQISDLHYGWILILEILKMSWREEVSSL